MLQLWKVPHIVKGTLSYVGPLYRWRLNRGKTGGTDAPAYCLKVWRRALTHLEQNGFDPKGASMVEFGPGDTIGVGLAALLSGVKRYSGLDVVPFARTFSAAAFFDELVALTGTEGDVSPQELRDIRQDLQRGVENSNLVRYVVPWSASSVAGGSADLVFSVAVLAYVEDLEQTFRTMYGWLRPGGYAYHWVQCYAETLSPYWNGHWAYSDLEWRLARGRRLFLNNRQPVSRYVALLEKAGFEVLLMKPVAGERGLPQAALVPPFRDFGVTDATTRGAHLVVRKPV